jgi:membrane protease YdiL (CAAX protease family)
MERNEILREIRRASNINGGALLLYTAIMFGSNIGLSVLLGLFDPEGTGAFYEYAVTALNLINIAAMVGGAFLIKKIASKKADISLSINRPKLPLAEVIKYMVIVLGVSYLFGYVSDFILSFIESAGITMSDIESDTSTPILYIVNIIGMAIFAPLFEELLFRGGLTGNVSRFGGFSMALAVGLSFGLWHENIYQFFYTAAMGTALCWLTMKTGSIFPAIITHFLFNVDTLPVMLLDLIDTELADTAYVLFLIFEFVMLIAAVILLISTLIIDKKQLSTKKPESEYASAVEFEKFFTYFSAPLTVIVVVWNILMTVINAAG